MGTLGYRGDASKRTFGYIHRRPNKRHYASYVGPDMKRHHAPSSFVRKLDAESWLAAEERLISDGEWVPPASRDPYAVAKQSTTLADYLEQQSKPARSTRGNRFKPFTAVMYRQHACLAFNPVLAGT